MLFGPIVYITEIKQMLHGEGNIGLIVESFQAKVKNIFKNGSFSIPTRISCQNNNLYFLGEVESENTVTSWCMYWQDWVDYWIQF